MERVKNATRCGICGASADKLESGIYVCQANPAHMADGFVGIWSDLTYPGEESARPAEYNRGEAELATPPHP